MTSFAVRAAAWRHPRAGRRCGAVLGLIMLMLGLGTATPRPAASAAPPLQRFLYVANDNEYEMFDIANGHRYVRTIALPGYTNPRGMRASAVTGRLYISYKSSPQGPSLVCFDLMTNTLLWAKPFPPDADAISLTPDGRTLYMASGENTPTDSFFVIDAMTGNQTGTLPIHPGTHNTIVNLTGTRVYISSLHYNYLYVVDTKTNQRIGTVGPFGDSIRPFTLNGRETLAFVNVNGLQGFEVADLTTGQVVHRVEVQGYPIPPDAAIDPSHGVGLTPDEREVWVAGASKFVHVFDATVMPPRQVASIPVNAVPKWIGFSLDGRYMYPGTGDVIDTQTRRVVGRIASSKRQLEVQFEGGRPVRAADIYGVGRVADTGLVIVGNRQPLGAGDQAVVNRLGALGYDLNVLTDAEVNPGSTNQMDLVVLSSTIASGRLNPVFRTAPVPLIAWEPFVFDDLGMTTDSATDRGFAVRQIQVAIRAPSHPLAAGLNGTVTAFTTPSDMAWGRPNTQGTIVATQIGDPTHATLFSYEAGAAMPGLTAPARRVGFLLSNTNAAHLTAQGWALFDAAVRWAAATP